MARPLPGLGDGHGNLPKSPKLSGFWLFSFKPLRAALGGIITGFVQIKTCVLRIARIHVDVDESKEVTLEHFNFKYLTRLRVDNVNP